MDDGSDGDGGGGGNIPGESELAKAMDGVDLDETKFGSKVSQTAAAAVVFLLSY